MKRLFYICLFSLAISTMAAERSVDDILRDGNNQFTAKVFNEVARANPGQSVILSAFSVMPPLAQLALASVGESHNQLLKGIGMPNDNVTIAAFSRVNTQIRSTKGITLNTASKIYIAENYELNSEFASTSRATFGSEVKNINFANSQVAAGEINEWVEDQTNHKIKDLVNANSLDPDTRALLVNAIYFKGSWQDPFRAYNTADRDFHITKDNVIKVPTMYRRGSYKYGVNKELKAQILEIPYSGDESSFLIVLPNDIDGIIELEEKLKDPSILDRATQDLQTTEVDIYIPKFKIETKTDLKEILQKINIDMVFNPSQAKLDKLLKNNNDLYISGAIQKAFIEINEEGTEAAAANVFNVLGSSYIEDIKPPPVFRADRPFYFAITSKSLTLFNGVLKK